jgi:hypothetical protein
VLTAKFTVPAPLMLNPAGEKVNVPALPVNAGEGLVPFWQYGEAG